MQPRWTRGHAFRSVALYPADACSVQWPVGAPVPGVARRAATGAQDTRPSGVAGVAAAAGAGRSASVSRSSTCVT